VGGGITEIAIIITYTATIAIAPTINITVEKKWRLLTAFMRLKIVIAITRVAARTIAAMVLMVMVVMVVVVGMLVINDR